MRDVRQAIQSSKAMLWKTRTQREQMGTASMPMWNILELTRTALQYQYLTQSLSGDIVRYRSAIKGQ